MPDAGGRPRKQHQDPFQTEISAASLASITTHDSKVIGWSPGLLMQGTLKISNTSGAGVMDLQISQLDNAATPVVIFGPVDLITGLDITADNDVVFLIGAGESAGLEGTGTLTSVANVLKIPVNVQLRLNVTTAAGAGTIADLHLVLLN